MRSTGHIRQRSKSSWELRYSRGTDPATGKRLVVTTTVRGDRKNAERELRRLLRTLDTGEHVDPTRMTVQTWLKQWHASKCAEVTPKTQERYGEIVNNFLIPAFGETAYPATYPLWRHVLFIIINVTFAWLLVRQKRWVVWPFALLTLQIYNGHGRAAWIAWSRDSRLADHRRHKLVRRLLDDL